MVKIIKIRGSFCRRDFFWHPQWCFLVFIFVSLFWRCPYFTCLIWGNIIVY